MTFLLSTFISPLRTATNSRVAGRRSSAAGLGEAALSWILNSSLMMLAGESLVRTEYFFSNISFTQKLIFCTLAFGWSAGYAGSALAVKNWAWQLTHPEGEPLPAEAPYANQDRLIESVKKSLEAGKKQSGRSPKILVIGAVSFLILPLDGISNHDAAWSLR